MLRCLLLSVLLTGCFVPTDDNQAAGLSGGAGSGSGGGGGSGGGSAGGAGTSTGAGASEWIAFDSDRGTLGRDVWVVRVDGSGLKKLTSNPGIKKEPAFSPDGTRLAFTSDESGTPQVHLLDLRTGARTQLTHGAAAKMPAWSPDGARILFSRDTALFTADVTTGTEQQVIGAPTGGFAGSGWRFPSFSRDGLSIVADSTYVIHKMSAQGGSPMILVPNTAAHEVTPVFSPDGAHIAFAEYCDAARHSIWVMPAYGLTERGCNAGSGAKRITAPDAPNSRRPAWSGDLIVYEQGAGDGLLVGRQDGDLMVISELGGAARVVTDGPGDDRNPAWAPPGIAAP